MKKEDFIKQIQAIGTCESDAERRAMIVSLENEASKDYDLIDTLNQTNATLMNDNKKLQESNMALFLQVTQSKGKANPEPEPEPEPEPKKDLKFEDLFNEKGELK